MVRTAYSCLALAAQLIITSGKSTQVPSFLLEHQLLQGKSCKIYCTEPRRISAISLARRVSEELGEGPGQIGTNRSLVGYSIRLESNTSKETRLVYATTGIVMRMLEGSNDLQEVTHLVLDEVHERSIDSDFLLIVLKKLLLRRKDLKVVLMSATVDAERFSKYLGGAPVLTVPGRTFPVRVAYLEDAIELTGFTVDQRNQEKLTELDDDAEPEVDTSSKPELLKALRQYSARTRNTLAQMDEYRIEYDLVVQLISRIAVDPGYASYSKAILVFLPGIAEIRALNDMLLGDRFFADNWLVYPMHSSIASEEQEAAFHIPPPGMRKIVLATNIAETGITIPDVTCVIDTGKHREMRFDERRQLSRLLDSFISRANAKQRRGRAGRVQEGLCFHLFTKYRHDTSMNDQQTPEMLRLSLQDLAIRVKICKIGGIEETLSQALDPPSAKNIRRAIDALVDVRALTSTTEELTPLGIQLARLPLDVFLGKLVLLGAIFKCLDMAITVAAILSSKSPFVAPFGQRAQADTIRRGFRKGDSDLLTVYNAYTAWKRVCQSATGGGAEFQFCRKNFLAPQTLANIEDLKGQLLVAVADSGFLQLTAEESQTLRRLRFTGRRRHQTFFEVPKRVNSNSDNEIVAQSVIAWSFYPKLLVRDGNTRGLRNVGNNQSISLHPSSVNKGFNDLRWMSYYNIMQSKAYVLIPVPFPLCVVFVTIPTNYIVFSQLQILQRPRHYRDGSLRGRAVMRRRACGHVRGRVRARREPGAVCRARLENHARHEGATGEAQGDAYAEFQEPREVADGTARALVGGLAEGVCSGAGGEGGKGEGGGDCGCRWRGYCGALEAVLLFKLGVRLVWIFSLLFWVSSEPLNFGMAVVWLGAWIAKPGELAGTVSMGRFRCIANETLSLDHVSATSSPRSCAVGQFLFESVERRVLSANRAVGCSSLPLSLHDLSCLVLPPPTLPRV